MTVGAKAEFRRSVAWRVSTAFGGLLSAFLMTVIATRTLTPRDAAVFLSVLAALFIGAFLGRLGLGPNVIRLLAAEKDPAEQRRIAGTHLRATLLLSVPTAPVIAILATVGYAGQLSGRLWLIGITSLLVACESFRLMLSDIFAAHGRIGASVATTHHVRSMIVLPFVYGLLLFSPRPPTLIVIVLVYAIASALQLSIALIAARDDVQLFAPRAHFSLLSAIRDGGLLFTLDLAAFVVLPATIWIASGLFHPTDAAHYAVAATLAQQVTVIEGLASLAVTPPVVRLWSAGHQDEARRMLSAVASVCAALAIIVVVFFAASGSLLLPLLYGPGLEHAGLLLVILAAGGIAKTAFGGSTVLLVISAHLKEAARTAAVVIVVASLATIVSAVIAGSIGLAIASSLAITALSVSQWLTARLTIPPAPSPSFNLRKVVRDLTGTRASANTAAAGTAAV